MPRPYRKRPRCGKWMPLARGYCGRPENHGEDCRSADALNRSNANAVRARRERRAAA
jgi:ribosomal protein L20